MSSCGVVTQERMVDGLHERSLIERPRLVYLYSFNVHGVVIIFTHGATRGDDDR